MIAQAIDGAALIKDFGGWGALIGILYYGGRTFMVLARDFSSKVVSELAAIRKAIGSSEARVDVLHEKVDNLAHDITVQSARIEHLNEVVSAHAVACKEKP